MTVGSRDEAASLQLTEIPLGRLSSDARGLLSRSSKEGNDGGDEPERERWGSRTMFLFAAIGSAIGLGNVWRFPYLVYKHGGGAFLIPYVCALLLVGMPVLLLELVLGQRMQKGAVGAFQKVHPRAWGVGLAAVLGSFVIVVYYNVLMSWAWIYLFSSFQSPLPWGHGLESAQAYFVKMLGETPNLDTLGPIQWRPCLGLLLTWVLVFSCISKGIKSAGPAALITMPLPFILLAILLVRGLTLPGMSEGLKFYLEPDLTALVDPKVWINATSQIFFSLSIAGGIMIAYGSYNGAKSNMNHNQLIICLANSGTSIFAGFVVFAILGYFARQTNTAVDSVTQGGVALAYYVFPAALAEMPWAPFFSIAFFGMLITLGLDSSFSLVEALCTVLYDWSPWLDKRKPLTAGVVCLVGFLLGLVMTTRGGRHILDIFDHYTSNYVLIGIGFLEVVLIGWVYGTDRLSDEVLALSGYRLPKLWVPIVKYVDPIILAILFVYNLVDEFISFYGDYPWWGIFMGWAVVLITSAIILFGAASPLGDDGVFSAGPGRLLFNSSASFGFRRPSQAQEVDSEDVWGTTESPRRGVL